MLKPKASEVAAKAVAAVSEGHSYVEMDCQALIEYCVNQCGGHMAYAGSNDMYRNACAYLETIENAKAKGKLVPGVGLFIVEAVSNSTPAKYRGDGLGDATHVGYYVGEKALQDTDKNGKTRWCNTVHSSASRQRVVGGTTSGGWTHVGWFKALDYGQAIGISDDSKEKETGNPGAAVIAEKPAVTVVADFYTVKQGCKGGAVRRLQTWLNDLGAVLQTDGEFGPATDTAVRSFQQAHGLVVDGIVGRNTWTALAEARAAGMEIKVLSASQADG